MDNCGEGGGGAPDRGKARKAGRLRLRRRGAGTAPAVVAAATSSPAERPPNSAMGGICSENGVVRESAKYFKSSKARSTRITKGKRGPAAAQGGEAPQRQAGRKVGRRAGGTVTPRLARAKLDGSVGGGDGNGDGDDDTSLGSPSLLNFFSKTVDSSERFSAVTPQRAKSAPIQGTTPSRPREEQWQLPPPRLSSSRSDRVRKCTARPAPDFTKRELDDLAGHPLLHPRRIEYVPDQSAYTTHITAVLDAVQERPCIWDLLSHGEQTAINRLRGLSKGALGLYARLHTRVGPWYQTQSFVRYEETGRSVRGVQAAVRELVEQQCLIPLPGDGHRINIVRVHNSKFAAQDEVECSLAIEAAHACLTSDEIKRVITKLGLGAPPMSVRHTVASELAISESKDKDDARPRIYNFYGYHAGRSESARSGGNGREGGGAKEQMLGWLRKCVRTQRTIAGRRLPVGHAIWRVMEARQHRMDRLWAKDHQGSEVSDEDAGVPIFKRRVSYEYDDAIDGKRHFLVRMASDFQALYRRIHGLYYLITDTAMLSSGYGWGSVAGNQHMVDGGLNAYGGFAMVSGAGTPPLFSAGLLCLFKKLAYPTYRMRFAVSLFPSRCHMLLYEAALKLQADLEAALVEDDFVQSAMRREREAGSDSTDDDDAAPRKRFRSEGGVTAPSHSQHPEGSRGLLGAGAESASTISGLCHAEGFHESSDADDDFHVPIALLGGSQVELVDADEAGDSSDNHATALDVVSDPAVLVLAKRAAVAHAEYVNFDQRCGPRAGVTVRYLDAGWVLSSTVWHAVECLERQRHTDLAIACLRQLLRTSYTPHRRGSWWERLCIDLAARGRHVEACIACKEAVGDAHVLGGDRLGLERRLVRLHRKYGTAAAGALARFRGKNSPSLNYQLQSPGSSNWRCPVCTLENDSNALQCTVCRKLRPEEVASWQLAPRPDDAAPFVEDLTAQRLAGMDTSVDTSIAPVSPFTATLALYVSNKSHQDTVREVVLEGVPLSSVVGMRSAFVGYDNALTSVDPTNDEDAVARIAGVVIPTDVASMPESEDDALEAAHSQAIPESKDAFEAAHGQAKKHIITEIRDSAQHDGAAPADILADPTDAADTLSVSVEDLCLQHYYKTEGWIGTHCEGGPIRSLFGLLMWDALFSDVPNAFVTPYQDAPLDLDSCDGLFFFRRETVICETLHRLCVADANDVVRLVGDSWRKHKGQCCRGVSWKRYSLHTLQLIAACIGGIGLAGIFDSLAFRHRYFTGGLPDLLMWRSRRQAGASDPVPPRPVVHIEAASPETAACEADIILDTERYIFEARFAEVKGPRDSLMDRQRAWLRILVRAGIDTELTRVLECSALGKRGVRKRTPQAQIEKLGP